MKAAFTNRAAFVVVSAVLALPLLGCDLQELVLQSELAPSLRDSLVRDCCECLANGQTFLPGDACSGEELPDADEVDAGPLTRNPCLCGVDVETCSAVLVAGGIVDVVGGCTALGGMCHPACDRVLAYP